MESTKEILTELQEIAPALVRSGLSRIPFAVPAGYFEGFPEILMKQIQRSAEFFDQSAELAISSFPVNSEISPLEEISTISPLLAGLQNKNPYQVPDGYFEAGKIKIPASTFRKSVETSENSPAKLVALNSGLSQSDSIHYQQGSIRSQAKRISILPRIIKYAVAACLVALLGITIYNVTNRSVTDPLHGLTTVSDQDMANYLDADDIHWTPGLAPETASVEFTDNDIRALFTNVSDAELEQYHPALPEEKGSVN